MRVICKRGWKTGAWWAALLLAGALAQPAAARLQGDDDAVKKEIQAALDRGTAAVVAKDFDTYGKELAAEYRSTDILGETVERDKAVEQLKALVEPAENVKATMTVESLKVKGDEATALVRIKGSADMKDGDGKAHTVKFDQREVQIWAKMGDAWRLRDSMQLTSDAQVDDKPFAQELKGDESAARDGIQTSYDALAKAALAGDADAFAKPFPEEFVAIPLDGGVTQKRDEFLASMKEQIKTPPSKVEIKVDRTTVNVDKAVVITTLKVEGERDNGDGKKKMTATMVERDTWKKTDSGWVPVEFRPLFREITLDGKAQPVSYAYPPKRA